MVLRIPAVRGIGTVVFVLAALVLVLLTPAAAQDPAPASAVWLADHKHLKRIDIGTNQVDLTVALDHEAEALAVDPTDGGVWALVQKKLSKFDSNGQTVFQVDLKGQAEKLDDPELLTLNPYDGSLWIGGEKVLLHLSAQGTRLQA